MVHTLHGSLLANDNTLRSELTVGSADLSGSFGVVLVSEGTSFRTDETLYFTNGVLGVNTAKEVIEDNTLPITSAAVASTVGNIEILLNTI